MRGEADEAVLDLLDGDAVGDDGVARVREDALDVAELVACGLEAVVVVRRRGGEERGHHPQREHRGEQRGDERDGRGGLRPQARADVVLGPRHGGDDEERQPGDDVHEADVHHGAGPVLGVVLVEGEIVKPIDVRVAHRDRDRERAGGPARRIGAPDRPGGYGGEVLRPRSARIDAGNATRPAACRSAVVATAGRL